MNEIYHHGILGMKWGVRRYQNKDGSLTNAGRKRYSDDKSDAVNSKKMTKMLKKDEKWAKKNLQKITAKAHQKSQKELNDYFTEEKMNDPYFNTSNGKVNRNRRLNAYYKKMAELMNEKVSNVKYPSGRVLKFVGDKSGISIEAHRNK